MTKSAATPPEDQPQVEAAAPTENEAAQQAAPAKRAQPPRTLDSLPPYTRSLLKVKVPVVVTLASRKETIMNITELGPGTILQFDKSCEEPLQLEAGGQPLAHGEAVKVGDKFGLRILSMLLPHERFRPVGNRSEKDSRKRA